MFVAMKRLVVIFLSMLYVVMSSGFTMYTHFCNGIQQGKAFSVNEQPDRPCNICVVKNKQQKKKKGCCKHKSELVKVTDSVKKTANQTVCLKVWGDVIPNKTLGAVFDINIESQLKTVYTTPSNVPIPGNPIYILNCVYRI
jgi:hypothetical protein